MRVILSQIAAISALVPAMAWGQTPSIFDVRDATKDAFKATSKALDTIEADRSKGKPGGAKKSPAAAKPSTKPGETSSTMFSKMADQASRSETARGASNKPTIEEHEKKFLSFLGSSSDMVYRGALAFFGLTFVCYIGMRIKEKVKDITTGRPSLARSRIIRR